MKKEYFKKNTESKEIKPNIVLKINNLLSKLIENGGIRLYGPLLLGVGLLTVFLMDEALGIFLGITNSMNLAAEAGKNSLGETSQCCSGFSKTCSSLGKSCQPICKGITKNFTGISEN